MFLAGELELPPELPCLELQPAIAMSATTQARTFVGVMDSMDSLDDRNRRHALVFDGRRAAASGNSRRKRLQAGAKLRIGDLAQPLAELLRHGGELWPLWLRRRRWQPTLLEDDAVHRRIAEEAIDPLHDHRGE